MLRTILMLLPQIIQLVKVAEQLMPEGGQGRAKLDHVLDAIGQIVGAVPDLATKVDAIKAAAAPVVSVIVGTFNALGHFTKGAAAPAMTTTPADTAAGGALPAGAPSAPQLG